MDSYKSRWVVEFFCAIAKLSTIAQKSMVPVWQQEQCLWQYFQWKLIQFPLVVSGSIANWAAEMAEGEHPVSAKCRGLRNRFVRCWVLGATHEQPIFTSVFEKHVIFSGANRFSCVSAAFQLRFSCVSAAFVLT